MKWYKFKPNVGSNRQKLPPERKYVLVRVKNLARDIPELVCVGYLRYHAGIKSEPFFVIPGSGLDNPMLTDKILQWCDCLPDDFEWRELTEEDEL